jgi:hypothetical protein
MPRHGGRTKGTPNKVNSTIREQVEQEAGMPLPVLLTRIGIRAMNEGDHTLAVNALSKAAAYTYSRLQSVAVNDTSETTVPFLTVHNGVAKVPEDWPGRQIRFTGGPDKIPIPEGITVDLNKAL